MNLPHIVVQESGSRILQLLGFSWALVDPTQRFCDSMVIAVKRTLFCVHHWNAENRDLIPIRICGFSDSTINGLVMGHSQLIMLCYVDVGETLFFQGTNGRIPRSDGKEDAWGAQMDESKQAPHMDGVETTHFRCRWLSRFPRLAPVVITKLRDMLCCCVLC